MTDHVPFTILTGFLGAGKTTTLNRMLAAPHGRRIAVLVNELGRIAIDSRLIVHRGGDVLELAGGCVCCKLDVKSDLWDGIAEVVRRTKPEQVVLETTGIAEPDAILEGLARLPDSVRGRITPAGVIAVVDAEAGAPQLDRRDEARAQVTTADRVLLRKLDRATSSQLAATRARIADLNPRAELASFPDSDDGAMALTGWLLERRTVSPSGAHSHHHHDDTPAARGHHHRHSQLNAAVFSDESPLLADAVLSVIHSLGPQVVRIKGFVRLSDDPLAAFLELAGTALTLRRGLPWPTETPRTDLVLIGDGLDEPAIRRALWACRVAD